MARRDSEFAAALENAGIDLKKDFYQLSRDELSKVDDIRKTYRFSGANSLGRSAGRQFYYAAQRGYKKNNSSTAARGNSVG